MQFQCPKCKSLLESDAVTEGAKVRCPECSDVFNAEPYIRKVRRQRPSRSSAAPADNVGKNDLPELVHYKVTSAIGIEKLQGFSLSALFSETFSHHSREEVEESFTVGTKASTPGVMEVDSSWPRPWLFMRMLLASLVLYFLFWIGWREFENQNLVPGWIMIGSFAVPISTLVLFLELNVRRNVSLYMVSRLTFLGGILSLLVSLVFFELFDTGLWGAMSAGPIEESGKLLAMLAVARGAKYRYKLNGLLVGAAVGVGFAAFESAGYAMRFLVNGVMNSSLAVLDQADSFSSLLQFGYQQGTASMENSLVTRGLLAPLGHVVWSAIVGCAMWRTMRGRKFRAGMLVDVDFVRLMIVPVFLHMIWNSPIQLPFYGKYLLVGAAGWFICLSLVQEGLREIREEQAGGAPKDESGNPTGADGADETHEHEAAQPVDELTAEEDPAERPNAIGCYLGVFKRYFDFTGRTGKREFWWAVLCNGVAFFLALVLDRIVFDEYDDGQYAIVGLFVLVTAMPMLAAQVRRLHDTGKSGWWMCLFPMPILNFILFIWFMQRSSSGAKQFVKQT